MSLHSKISVVALVSIILTDRSSAKKITAETRIEGKPEAKARATVRFVTKDQADHALDIVVRPERKR